MPQEPSQPTVRAVLPITTGVQPPEHVLLPSLEHAHLHAHVELEPLALPVLMPTRIYQQVVLSVRLAIKLLDVPKLVLLSPVRQLHARLAALLLLLSVLLVLMLMPIQPSIAEGA